MPIAEAQGRLLFLRPPELAGAEVMVADGVSGKWRYFHETYSFATVLSTPAPVDWTYRGQLHTQVTGSVSLMQPGEVHANTKTTPAANFRAIFLDPALVERAAAERGMRTRRPNLAVAQIDRADVFSAFVRLHAAIESGASALECQSRLCSCLRLILDRFTETGSPRLSPAAPDGIARARDLIHDRLAQNISLGELASAANLSRFHLLHEFERRYGLPPHAYQLAVRIERARRLLAGRAHPTRVAADLGFADQSHFGRLFKRALGVTPAAYRANGR